MKVLVVFVVVASLYSSNAMPFNDCRDHYDLCGKWAKHQYCELSDYKDYMSLVCPYSCGVCDDILNDLSASGKEASGTGDVQKVIPEVDADFDNFEELGRISSPLSDKEADHKDEELSQSLSGSGEEKDEPLFRASATQETESRFHGEVEQQDGTGDQQESISGSGGDSVGVNFWPVVRIALDTDDGGSDREHHVIRRSEISTPEETTKVSEKTTKVPEETTTRVLDDGSSSGEATSGEKLIQRSDFPIASESGQDDVTSGEDDAPFDTSSADLESDSGCSSGYGCYESQGQQGGDGGDLNSRSLIAKAEESVASGSASGDSTPDVWLHPHFDVAAGPYDDVTSGSGAAPLVIGSEDEQEETDVHEIEDAIFETGIPLQISRDTGSGLGSGIPSPPQSENYDDSETSGMGSGAAERDEAVELFTAPQQQHRMNLMEKLIKLGKLQAIKITHETVGASSRNEVPRVTDEDDNTEMQSDLGKGMNVTFVLNQDFHSGYANENSAAYNILANSVKKEVERALGSQAVVSEISFTEVREPAQSPRFSKVLTSLKLLGDVTKLEKDVKKGMISNLVVDKTFFHAI